jgi:hypothetical protein
VFSNVEASCSSAIMQGETRTAHKSGECTMAQLYKKIYPYVLVVWVYQSIRRLPELLTCNQFKYRLQQLIEISENYLNSLLAQ